MKYLQNYMTFEKKKARLKKLTFEEAEKKEQEPQHLKNEDNTPVTGVKTDEDNTPPQTC